MSTGAIAGAVGGTINAIRQKCIENMSSYPSCDVLINGNPSPSQIHINLTVLIIPLVVVLGIIIFLEILNKLVNKKEDEN